jgi:SynChlorMet cassette protein ScmC
MYSFPLSSGLHWYLEAGDPAAESAVDGAAAVMRLPRISPRGGHRDPSRRVRVFSAPPEAPPEGISCVLPRPNIYGNTTFDHYTTIAYALARGFAREGGVLLHGALAEYRPDDSTGRGVVFSAHGGAGKTTASRRLPVPWRSLSDDAVLVMPAGAGRYRAHPWPTWSSFLHEDHSGTRWDVQTSVPLHACIFLRQAAEDSIASLGPGKAASLLAESTRQINFLDIKLPPQERRLLRLQRFDAICSLAKTVPAHLLGISLEGEFWSEVERVLG